jgi:hypothetical protein
VEKTSNPTLLAEWKRQEIEAQSKRDKMPKVMDIYDIKTSKG